MLADIRTDVSTPPTNLFDIGPSDSLHRLQDYTGENVNVETFLAVLAGKEVSVEGEIRDLAILM
jgi:hypothetical protein